MAQQAWHRPVLPAHYLPNTREETGCELEETSPPGGTARLATGTPRRQPPLSSGPTSVWRQPSLSAALRGRQRAARSFWRSGCGSRICTMLLRDTATLRLDLPPPRAVLAGSPGEAAEFAGEAARQWSGPPVVRVFERLIPRLLQRKVVQLRGFHALAGSRFLRGRRGRAR